MRLTALAGLAWLMAANLLALLAGWWDTNAQVLVWLNILTIAALLVYCWLATFRTVLIQRALNRSMLSILKDLASRLQENAQSELADVMAQADQNLRSGTTAWLALFGPWRRLNQQVGLARKLVSALGFRQDSLTAEQKQALEDIHIREKTLLSRRVGYGPCRHRDHYYSSSDDNPFICLQRKTVLNSHPHIEAVYWCKYCLVSFQTGWSISVIVK